MTTKRQTRAVPKDEARRALLKTEESFIAAQRRQLGGLLKMKNAVAYEQRLLTEVEARKLSDHAVRFVKWAGEVVNKQLG